MTKTLFCRYEVLNGTKLEPCGKPATHVTTGLRGFPLCSEHEGVARDQCREILTIEEAEKRAKKKARR